MNTEGFERDELSMMIISWRFSVMNLIFCCYVIFVVFQKKIRFEVFHPRETEKSMFLDASGQIGLYTVLPADVLEEFGVKTGSEIQYLKLVEPGKDHLSNLPLWEIGVRINGLECITRAIEGEEAAIGFLTLAQLGLEFRGGQHLVKMVAYSDPLVYDVLFNWVFNIYHSIYYIEPARELYSKLVTLYNEVIIDQWKSFPPEGWKISSYIMALASLVNHGLTLTFSSLYTGALPSVALGVRLSLEALVAGYFGDVDPEISGKFSDSVSRFEKASKDIRHEGFRYFCSKRLTSYIPDVSDVIELWDELSYSFIHSIGLFKTSIKSDELPSVLMGGPYLSYHEGDVPQLRKLNKLVERFGKFFGRLHGDWSNRFGVGGV